jgi:hypothetical protein
MAFIFDLAIVFGFFMLNILVYHKNIVNNNTKNIILLLLSYFLVFFLIFFHSKNNNNLLFFAILFLPCLSSILFLPKVFDTKITNYLQNGKVSYIIFFITTATLTIILFITLLVLISFSTQIKENIAIHKHQHLMQVKDNPLLDHSHNTHLAVQKFYLKENISIKTNHPDNIYAETKKISINLPFFSHHELLILTICLAIILMPFSLYK